jgi:hypothetical protein
LHGASLRLPTNPHHMPDTDALARHYNACTWT